MPLYGVPTHPNDAPKTPKPKKYPLATLSLVWFLSPIWGGVICGWIVVMGGWPQNFSAGLWWMIGITYFITWIAAWVSRWYHEDTYATGRKDSPIHEVITGW